MSQDFSVLLHTPTDGTDGDCTASLKNPRGIEPRRILPQPRGSQAHTCMSPQSSDCLTFIHNLKPSDPSIFFRTPHRIALSFIWRTDTRYADAVSDGVKSEVITPLSNEHCSGVVRRKSRSDGAGKESSLVISDSYSMPSFFRNSKDLLSSIAAIES